MLTAAYLRVSMGEQSADLQRSDVLAYLRDQGKSYQIARELGCGQGTVRAALKGQA